MFEGIKPWFEGSEEALAAVNSLFSAWRGPRGVPEHGVQVDVLSTSWPKSRNAPRFEKAPGRSQVACTNVVYVVRPRNCRADDCFQGKGAENRSVKRW